MENIPVGGLGLIALTGCEELGKKVDDYLVRWRRETAHEHRDDAAFAGYERDTYMISADVPRFGSGEAKGILKESVRGKDLYLMVDVCNYSVTYSLTGRTNHMSPDDHFQNLKRIIAAVGGLLTLAIMFTLGTPTPRTRLSERFRTVPAEEQWVRAQRAVVLEQLRKRNLVNDADSTALAQLPLGTWRELESLQDGRIVRHL